VYFDNAASTQMHEEVIQVMTDVMRYYYANPSSIHSSGTKSKVIIENSRRTIANLLNVEPSEIFFTSGGTESNNQVIKGSIDYLGIKNVITSPIEHDSVLSTLDALQKHNNFKVSYVKIKSDGHIDFNHLEELLKKYPDSLVSLMHANNEIGNLLSIKETGELCKKYNSIFHSDTVQTIGHFLIDLSKLNLHFASCSAHKFHGPKGIGFIYIDNSVKINPLISGGHQEKNMRGGTENIAAIAGMSKALEIAVTNIEKDQKCIKELKDYTIKSLKDSFNDIEFNGDCINKSLFNIISISFPKDKNNEMLLYLLDMKGIAVSSGSACSSGTNNPSHVFSTLYPNSDRIPIRISFSIYNKKEEIDFFVSTLKQILTKN
ncbi:MAG: cysteine desulfurase family protein, partial [Bacteroidota bacterium]|nr:cysteine desulfurase family protein [Bacteroidota bacterium]